MTKISSQKITLIINQNTQTQNFIRTSNHMFGTAIWDKLPEWISKNFEIVQVKRAHFQSSQKSRE